MHSQRSRSKDSNLEKSSSKNKLNSEESSSKQSNSTMVYSTELTPKELESNGSKSPELKISEPETGETETKETNWSIDISSILKDQKCALEEIKEHLELDGDALFLVPSSDDKLPTKTIMFCANIIGIVRHLEKRFELNCKYKLTKAQKRYIENGSSEKEKMVRRHALKWQFMLKEDFYLPLCSALEEKQIPLQKFCRSVGVVHQMLIDTVKSQSKYSPVVVTPIPGEIQCLPEHVECFKVFLDILK
ncbi:uncharacterized protein LOC135844381 isoform X2 [Planococcus citri]|uniref:uncharacterized protein LOC135844381 isoform X2 n=1 Tax=Planococcus citri TaxID=170843 RepID=UPI0031F9874B